MKKLLLIITLLTIGYNSYSQKVELPLKDSSVVYEDVIKLKDSIISADKLFTIAQTWFANTFKNSKSVLQVNDRQSSKLIGKGLIQFSGLSMPLNTYLYYSIAVDIKQGRYRYKIYDIGYEAQESDYNISTGYSHYLHGEIHRLLLESKKKAVERYEGEFIFADRNIRLMIESLKANMQNLNADNF